MKTTVESLEHLLRAPYLYFAAVTVVLLVALYLVRSYLRAHQGIVPFKTEGGTIEIAPQTLRGVMQNAANSVEGIHKATCHHFVRGRNVGVNVAVHLRANHRLKDVETTIKQRIRSTVLDQFGMETVDPIHIRVTRIVGDPIASVPGDINEPDAFSGDDFEEGTTPPDAEDGMPDSKENRP